MSRYNRCEECYNMKCVFVTGERTDIDTSECEDFRPMTNADHIRAMSDHDLAEFLCAIMDCCGNDACGTFCPMWKCCNDGPDNVEDWLKLPVDKERER